TLSSFFLRPRRHSQASFQGYKNASKTAGFKDRNLHSCRGSWRVLPRPPASRANFSFAREPGPGSALRSVEKRAVAKHSLPETGGQDGAVGGRHHERQRLSIDLDLRKDRSVSAVREIADFRHLGHGLHDPRRAEAGGCRDPGEVDAGGRMSLLHSGLAE